MDLDNEPVARRFDCWMGWEFSEEFGPSKVELAATVSGEAESRPVESDRRFTNRGTTSKRTHVESDDAQGTCWT